MSDDQKPPRAGRGFHRKLVSTIRGRLVLLVMALLVPAIFLASALLFNSYQHARHAAERQLSDTARALSMVVDRQIGQSQTLIDALATARSLAAGDYAAFDAQARRANHDPARWVIVLQHDGQQRINTSLPWGQKLPMAMSSIRGATFVTLPGGISCGI